MCIWHELVDQTFYGPSSHKVDRSFDKRLARLGTYNRNMWEGSASDDSTHDHDNTTTPTTKGRRSDVSIISLGWSVTLGPSQYPRHTSATKRRGAVGSPGDSQSRQTPQEHGLHKNVLNMVAERCGSRLFRCGCCRAGVVV